MFFYTFCDLVFVKSEIELVILCLFVALILEVLDNVDVVDNENFILLSWNQTFSFDNVVIYLNEKKQAFNNCTRSTLNKSIFVNCSLDLNRKLSPGELLNVTVVVDDSINSSTSYVKRKFIHTFPFVHMLYLHRHIVWYAFVNFGQCLTILNLCCID